MSSIKKTDHFYLIDGSGYIFRAYYALPPLSRKSDGLPTGAVSGFCSMLFKLLEDARSDDSKNRPSHFAVIFDSARKNFRNDIYSEYKANRSEAPEDLIPQFEYIRKSVKAFNLPSIEMINYEADDLIATYVEKILSAGASVTIISSDKDLMQLVKPNVRLYDPIKSKVLGEKEIKEKFGVSADQVTDVQALAGDTSDNIPGVPGIGIKTAAELINKYNNLDNLFKMMKEIPQKKRRETLLENKSKAILSKRLVVLKKDVPIKDELSSFILKEVDKTKLFNFLREMEFNRLLSLAISHYGKDESKDNTFDLSLVDSKFDLTKYTTIKSISDLDSWIKTAENNGYLSVDTETDSLNPVQANLIGISLCTNTNKACYIPIKHKGFDQLNIDEVIKKLKPILEDDSVKKIGQNIKYDYIVLLNYNIKLNPIDDTMLMSYTLEAGNHRHGMDYLSETYLGHKPISFKEVTGSGKNQKKFSEVSIDLATKYSAEDSDVTLRLYKFFKKRLDKEKLNKIYEIFEKPFIKILALMEIAGVKIDSLHLKKLSIKFEKKIKFYEDKIFNLSKKKFNIASPKQLGDILYNDLKIAKLKKTKKGSYATSASVLENLAFQGHELPKLVLEWRKISKLKNTYSDTLPEHIYSRTNRVHTSFLLAATTTGRLASSNPNLQNIPIKTEYGREIRKAFVANADHYLISADYNQIEMRILADLADVKELKKAFKNNEDIHSLTASQVFNVSLKKVDQETRRKAKAINFGIIYGISEYGLAKQISVSNHEASEFLVSYFKKFPEIKEYMNSTIKFCRKNGYVQNIFGRKCHIRGINDKNFNVRAFQERAAINAPIQGSAADLMKLAMINIHKLLNENKKFKTQMLLQIHDELVFETPKNELKVISPMIEKIMSEVVSSDLHAFSIPLVVDVSFGNNWDEAH